MDLKHFLQLATKRERAAVASVCNDSVPYLYQIAGKHRRASPQLATQIRETDSNGCHKTNGRLEAVPRESLVRHPEIFTGFELEDE